MFSGVLKAGPQRGGGMSGAGYPTYDMAIDTSLGVPTATENRPVNTAVRYLISALP